MHISAQVEPDSSELLEQFFETGNPRHSDFLLERLLREHAAPIVQRIVCSKVRPPASEDVQHDVLVDLIARLQQVKRSGEWAAIADFRSYSAVAAFHGCREYYRQSFPERYRLRSRVRYLLVRHPQFTIWKTQGGTWMCGRQEVCDAPAFRSATKETARLVDRMLEELSTPLPFEHLVERLGSQFGAPMRRDTPPVDHPDPAASVETRLIQREWIRELWAEVDLLPLPQRISLLLSMRDDDGGSGLILFPMLGVASLRQIAARLAMPAEDLASMWGCLPLNDQRIGEHLRLDRQRVINLRKSARERLWRRAVWGGYAWSGVGL